ncbi:hypothetical protein CBG25_03630 [Arsenophonus sp. ENCA]|uniref:Cro/CI family transcriptional regulator n=1 Tax=Arsenophonus sp. ENCA TaxID=1987579 RepID=UPI000BD2A24C|nr:Cro/CI family transcriptional regulator [Arsenophonus sp. ENCA]PAV08854.1 hypothetical protein CBG25_03630 [Arsenophonus sp. ENCA]
MKKSEAIYFAGNKTNLAKLLKITKSAVSQWGDDIPELRALQLEKLVNDKNNTKAK